MVQHKSSKDVCVLFLPQIAVHWDPSSEFPDFAISIVRQLKALDK